MVYTKFYIQLNAIKEHLIRSSCSLINLKMFQSVQIITGQTYWINTRYCNGLHNFKLSVILTNSMEQSPSWRANRSSASQEIPSIIQNAKAHYCFHNSLLLVPILRQINPIHDHLPYLLKIHFVIFLPSTHRSSQWSLSFRLPHGNPVCPSSLPHKNIKR
jgi:hypothetical protein